MALTPEEHITFVLKKRVGWSRERALLVKGCSFNVRTTRLRLDPQNPEDGAALGKWSRVDARNSLASEPSLFSRPWPVRDSVSKEKVDSACGDTCVSPALVHTSTSTHRNRHPKSTLWAGAGGVAQLRECLFCRPGAPNSVPSTTWWIPAPER